MTIKNLKAEFLSRYALSSERTKQRYNEEIDLFLNVCGVKTVEEIASINSVTINKYYNYAKERAWSPSTINQRMQSIKLFTKWLFNKKYIANDYMSEVKKMRTYNEVHYCPSNEECERLLDTIKKHTKKQRLYLMTKLALSSGLRRSELCNLKVEDLNKANSSIKVFGKGKKIVEQPIPSSLMIELSDYVNTERREVIERYKTIGGKDLGFLFISGIGEKCNKDSKNLKNGNRVDGNVFYQQLKRFARKAGLEKFELMSPHALRRSSGTNIYESTGDIKTASEFLRHSSTATTEKCYINYNRNKLVDAVNNVFNANTKEKENNMNELSEEEQRLLFELLQKKFKFGGQL